MEFIEPLSNGKILKVIDNSYEIMDRTYKCNVCNAPLLAGQTHKENTPGIKCKGKATPNNFPIQLDEPIWKTAKIPIKSTIDEIYRDIFNYIKDHCFFTNFLEYHILACWIITTYFLDYWYAVPYLLFLGPKGSGKSRALEVIEELSYRGFKTSNNTPATIFRAVDQYKITYCIDEIETINIKFEGGQDMLSMLNNGYKFGAKVVRNVKVNDEYILKSFNAFGFKAFGTTKMPFPTLQDRCIVFNMIKHKVKNPIIDYERAIIIRSKLLYLKIQGLKDLTVNVPAEDRLRELYYPIYRIAQEANPALIPAFRNYIKATLIAEAIEEKFTLEVQILNTINARMKAGENVIRIKDLASDILLEDYNYNPPEHLINKIAIRIGLKMKTLGLKRNVIKGNKRVIIIEENKDILEKLSERYLKEPELPFEEVEPVPYHEELTDEQFEIRVKDYEKYKKEHPEEFYEELPPEFKDEE